jgi:hypothetical protein
MPLRSWQRDLDSDPGSEIAQIVRRQETPPEPIDLNEFVRAFLDGAIGDAGPFTAQDDALAACERCIADRIRRPLNKSESVKIGLTMALAWNQRLVRARSQVRLASTLENRRVG